MRKAGEEWKRSGHQSVPTSGGLSRDYLADPEGRQEPNQARKLHSYCIVCLHTGLCRPQGLWSVNDWPLRQVLGSPFTSSISGFRTFNLTNLTLQLSLSWGDNSEHKMCSFWITYHICLVLLVLRSLLDASFQCCSGFLVSRYAYSSFCEYRGSNTHFLFSPAAYFINEDI